MVMIEAGIDGDTYTLAMTGHATGSDTACAACSALAYALAGWAVNAERDGVVEILTNEISSGCFRLKYRAPKNRDAAETAFDMAIIGFMQIEKTEPGRVLIKIVMYTVHN